MINERLKVAHYIVIVIIMISAIGAYHIPINTSAATVEKNRVLQSLYRCTDHDHSITGDDFYVWNPILKLIIIYYINDSCVSTRLTMYINLTR